MGDINLNVKDIAGVGEAMDKGSRGIARLFPGAVRRSEANAERKVTKRTLQSIDEIRKFARENDLPDDVVNCLCRDTVKRITRNENLDQIVFFAEPLVEDSAEVEDLVGSEWLNYFVDHAERVTDKEAQRVWASLLVGEVNKRGTFSKNAMRTLSVMDMEDAKVFRRLCKFIADGYSGRVLVIEVDNDGSTYNDGALTYTELSNLASLGLVDTNGTVNLSVERTGWVPFAHGDGLSAYVCRSENGGKSIRFNPILTRAGRELSALCEERDFAGIVRVLNAKARKNELRFRVLDKNGKTVGII